MFDLLEGEMGILLTLVTMLMTSFSASLNAEFSANFDECAPSDDDEDMSCEEVSKVLIVSQTCFYD